ncbi:MAG: arginine--tRNA ligase [Myxococcota bacterium]
MRERVERLLREATERVVQELRPAEVARAHELRVIPSQTPEHGDFSCSVALALARPLGLSPRELAERIHRALRDPEGLIDRTEVAGPGYLNVFLAQALWHALLERILREREQYGTGGTTQRERVLVEFVSANPTGPLTIGHGRNAVLGDAIARLLEACGHEVTREYYFNNGGRQMRILGASLRARYLELLGRPAELPAEGYEGKYLVKIARGLVEREADRWVDAPPEAFERAAEAEIFGQIRATLARLDIRFDEYTNERGLYEQGRVEATLSDLEKRGLVYQAEGATWLRATELGLDRDRVLVKSNGEPTYLLPDIAYHLQKLERGFDRMIDVLGPDHIEQFPYVRAATIALQEEGKRVEAVVYQWVNLRKGGEIVKMSTRKASFVTVDEVLDEIGADVFRFFMLERRADTHLDFDLDLACDRSERNPVFKIQYAHARMCSIERLAVERGFDPEDAEPTPYERLESAMELELCKAVGQYPDVRLRAADLREPQELARYLLDLATAFHSYISDSRRHRVISDDVELSRARLALVRAVRIVLGNGLRLLGLQAPERM